MSKEIKIGFTWSRDLAIEASQKFYEYDMRHSNKRYLGWFFVGLTQFAIVGALKHDSYGLLYASTFLVAYWYYGRWYLRKAMLGKFYDKQGLDAKEAHFTLKEEGLYNETTLIEWEKIFRVIKMEGGVLVQIQNNTLYFKRDAFNSYEDMQSFLEMMRREGKI